jgi:hypothetical protein
MKRTDLINLGKFYSATLRREASARRARYPEAANKLDRWAAATDRTVEEMRCGPLFGSEER